jgi:hypothetical protein
MVFPGSPVAPGGESSRGISSGDTSPASHVLRTFNPLFPSGLHYRYIDSTGSLNAIVKQIHHEELQNGENERPSPFPKITLK